MSTEPIIVCEGVGKRFDGDWVVRGIDLMVCPGEILGIIGPGGHGKSILLKLLAGLIKPDEGRVLVHGSDLSSLDPLDLSRIRAEFGYLFQNYALFDFMTVADNVAFPLRQMQQLDDEEIPDKRRVKQRLEDVDLGHTLALFPNELSGGMKKRVGMARATVSEPRIVLYDDPSAGLDPVTSSKIFRLVNSMHHKSEGVASVVVSHDIDRMKVICDRYAMIYEGRVLFVGAEDAIAAADPLVGKFFFGAIAAKTHKV